MLKADAYGHGGVACARALADCADGYAVAVGCEASALRAAGIATPLLVLEGVFTTGGIFVAPRRTRVGLVALGYADGYPRATPTGTPVAVDGHVVGTIGRVSMDMLTVDLTDVPAAGVGSPVELWGRHISVADVARGAGTIAYELLCNAKRAPRLVVDDVDDAE